MIFFKKFSPNILLIILYQLTQVSSSLAFILFEILHLQNLRRQISKFLKGNNSKKNHMNFF